MSERDDGASRDRWLRPLPHSSIRCRSYPSRGSSTCHTRKAWMHPWIDLHRIEELARSPPTIRGFARRRASRHPPRDDVGRFSPRSAGKNMEPDRHPGSALTRAGRSRTWHHALHTSLVPHQRALRGAILEVSLPRLETCSVPARPKSMSRPAVALNTHAAGSTSARSRPLHPDAHWRFLSALEAHVVRKCSARNIQQRTPRLEAGAFHRDPLTCVSPARY